MNNKTKLTVGSCSYSYYKKPVDEWVAEVAFKFFKTGIDDVSPTVLEKIEYSKLNEASINALLNFNCKKIQKALLLNEKIDKEKKIKIYLEKDLAFKGINFSYYGQFTTEEKILIVKEICKTENISKIKDIKGNIASKIIAIYKGIGINPNLFIKCLCFHYHCFTSYYNRNPIDNFVDYVASFSDEDIENIFNAMNYNIKHLLILAIKSLGEKHKHIKTGFTNHLGYFYDKISNKSSLDGRILNYFKNIKNIKINILYHIKEEEYNVDNTLAILYLLKHLNLINITEFLNEMYLSSAKLTGEYNIKNKLIIDLLEYVNNSKVE